MDNELLNLVLDRGFYVLDDGDKYNKDLMCAAGLYSFWQYPKDMKRISILLSTKKRRHCLSVQFVSDTYIVVGKGSKIYLLNDARHILKPFMSQNEVHKVYVSLYTHDYKVIKPKNFISRFFNR